MSLKKIRILQVITNLGTGGAEKLLVDSIPLYIKKGMDVDLLLLNSKQFPFYDQLKGIGVNIISLSNGSVYNPLLIFKIIPYFKKYDIIHVHLFPTLYWVAIAKLLSFSKIRLIFTEHSTNNRRINSYIGRLFDRLVYRVYDKIVSITVEMDRIMKDHLLIKDDNRFEVIFNGINLSKFRSKSSSFILKDNIKIIQVSSFNDSKDQFTLIRAMEYLPDNIYLQLVGEGKNKAICEKLVLNLQLENRVHFLGVRLDVPQLLSDSDIVVLSSCYEGLSLSSIEGMISGRPFIASDVPGLSNVVEGAGILFPPGDAKALADKIQMLLSDEELYVRTAKACQKRAENYDINNMVDSYIDLYRKLLN